MKHQSKPRNLYVLVQYKSDGQKASPFCSLQELASLAEQVVEHPPKDLQILVQEHHTKGPAGELVIRERILWSDDEGIHPAYASLQAIVALQGAKAAQRGAATPKAQASASKGGN